MGYDKIYSIAASRYFWIGMSSDLKQLLKTCHVSAEKGPNPSISHYHSLKQDIASHPFERIAMDVLGSLEQYFPNVQCIKKLNGGVPSHTEAETQQAASCTNPLN